MRLVFIYQLIYYIIVTIFTIKEVNYYKSFNNSIIKNHNQSYGIFIVLIFILMIGLRPTDDYWFADSYWYNRTYNILEGQQFILNPDTENFIWDNIFNYFASKQLGVSTLFFLSDIIYFGCAFLACRKFFPKDYTAAFLVFLGAFSTFSYSYNGIKSGLAASIFLLALAYKKNFLLSILLVIISWGFHHSMQLPVGAYIIARIYKNPKSYLILWVICLIIAMFHISVFQDLFASWTDESGSRYLNPDDKNELGVSGFRLDFILYSAVPILIGYIATYKKKFKPSTNYLFILNIYLIVNSVWMLCMYARFSNRIAYLSWFIYPILLVYPFLKENWGKSRYKDFSLVMTYQLLFTLFLTYIYYL